MINIEHIGDYKHFSTLFKNGGYDSKAKPGRVCASFGKQCRVMTEQGLFSAEAARQVIEKSGPPVTGDWVVLRDEGGTWIVKDILKRRTEIARQSAGKTSSSQILGANIDTIFIVTGLDNNFNLRRIERFLTLVWSSGATPVVILNKADLCLDREEKVLEVQGIAPGVDVHAVSALKDEVGGVFEKYLSPGKTAVFTGSSGVGKSTLINKLISTDLLKTSEVREQDSRGKHTTTSRELYFLPGGGVLMDTPGIREIQLLDNQDGLDETFSDILALASECKFTNCAHESEPGCRIQEALDNGELDQSRFENYLKMQKEISYYNRNKKKGNSKKRWKEINQFTKQLYKRSPKYDI